MAFANFEGTCQLDPALGKPIVCAAGFQAQAYVFRFFLDFPPFGVANPPTGKDRVATFKSDSARWRLAKYDDFVVQDLNTAMIHVKSNCRLMSDNLARRYTIRFQIVQESGGGSAVARPLSGVLTTSQKTELGVWQDLIVDVPFGSTTVGSFDATIPFVFD